MVKKSWDFWDILILIGAMIILFWALAKALGIINTPIWVNMLPYFGVSAAILGGVYKLGKIKRGIDETEQKVDRVLSIQTRFDKLEHQKNCPKGQFLGFSEGDIAFGEGIQPSENEHQLAMDGKLKIMH